MVRGRSPFVFLLILVGILGCNGLWVVAKEGEKKCFVEEIPRDTVVVATFRAESADPPNHHGFRAMQEEPKQGFMAIVKDRNGLVVQEKYVGMSGRVAFTSEEEGEHFICFYSNTTRWLGGGRKYHIHVKIDIADETVDYGQIAKAFSFNEVEVQAYSVNQKCLDVIKVQEYLKRREYTFRATTESTNGRVMWFSFFKICVLVTTAIWQVFYLKRFFKAKKVV